MPIIYFIKLKGLVISRLKNYYYLAKPGIIQGNLVTATAGFLLASKMHINLPLLAAILVGMSLVIASACVCNNVIDRDIDRKMIRTSKRALATGTITVTQALIFASFLGIAGYGTLFLYTNLLTVLIGIIGWVDYVLIYGIFKRRSSWGTIIGSISGATPPVAGYVAVTNRLDAAAVILFLILTFWQMPHFYAIAMYRLKDYSAAHIPVLPIKRGLASTKLRIMLYIAAFTVTGSALTIFGYTGYVYLAIIMLLGLGWLTVGAKGFNSQDDTLWARQMFVVSLIVITVLCLSISFGAVIR